MEAITSVLSRIATWKIGCYRLVLCPLKFFLDATGKSFQATSSSYYY